MAEITVKEAIAYALLEHMKGEDFRDKMGKVLMSGLLEIEINTVGTVVQEVATEVKAVCDLLYDWSCKEEDDG